MTDPNLDRIRAMRQQLTTLRSVLARWDRMIPIAVMASSYRGDGWPGQACDGGRSPGAVSDPVGGQIAAVADALELGAQLFGQLGHPGSWPMLIDLTQTIDSQMAMLASLLPVESTKLVLCSSGPQHAGYGSWGKTDATGAPVACTEIAEPDRLGLCMRCYRRRDRWRRDQAAA